MLIKRGIGIYLWLLSEYGKKMLEINFLINFMSSWPENQLCREKETKEKIDVGKTGDEAFFLATWLTSLIYKCIQYDDGNPCASRRGWNYGPRILRSLAWHDIDWLPITPQIYKGKGKARTLLFNRHLCPVSLSGAKQKGSTTDLDWVLIRVIMEILFFFRTYINCEIRYE